MTFNLGMGLHWINMGHKELVDVIQQAEALGYHMIAADNEKFYPYLYVTMTVIAENTSDVLVGSHVADPYTQHPAMAAIAHASVDMASDGRGVMILGAGGTGFREMGIDRKRPAQMLKESVQFIREFWKGDPVEFHGEVLDFNHGQINFDVRQDLPIYIASRGDLVLQAAGEVADGAMIATYAEPEGIKHGLAMVEKGAARADRTLDDLVIFSRCDTCISDDHDLAYDSIRNNVAIFLWTSYPDRKFVHRVGLEVPAELEEVLARRDYELMLANAHLVPDEFVDKLTWAGTPEEVAEKIAKVVDMGITNITIAPAPLKGGSIRDTVVACGEKVKPIVDALLEG